jgi:hypothetical protein
MVTVCSDVGKGQVSWRSSHLRQCLPAGNLVEARIVTGFRHAPANSSFRDRTGWPGDAVGLRSCLFSRRRSDLAC